VRLGEVVKGEARVVCTGRTSIEIAVVVEAENVFAGESHEAARGFFTMVALDRSGKPAEVPTWEPGTDEERRHCEAARERRDQRRKRG
ncbi:acyl-CoA thioesterase, partial [bacterium]|nr:acyl-CoA thioesterase [bacterium]